MKWTIWINVLIWFQIVFQQENIWWLFLHLQIYCKNHISFYSSCIHALYYLLFVFSCSYADSRCINGNEVLDQKATYFDDLVYFGRYRDYYFSLWKGRVPDRYTCQIEYRVKWDPCLEENKAFLKGKVTEQMNFLNPSSSIVYRKQLIDLLCKPFPGFGIAGTLGLQKLN